LAGASNNPIATPAATAVNTPTRIFCVLIKIVFLVYIDTDRFPTILPKQILWSITIVKRKISPLEVLGWAIKTPNSWYFPSFLSD
jgi:hypothetical protein